MFHKVLVTTTYSVSFNTAVLFVCAKNILHNIIAILASFKCHNFSEDVQLIFTVALQHLKGYANFFFPCYYLPSFQVPGRKIDIILSCACSDKEDTGRARPLLISLAQILVINGKC